MNQKEKLKRLFNGKLIEKEPLAAHTTFGIGGPADFFYVAETPEELVRAVQVAKEEKIPYFFLGGGSNLLVSDKGFRGLVIKNQCLKYEVNGDTLTSQSGVLLDALCQVTLENGLTGFEFLVGIKGTVGGAVYGNAGAFGHGIGDILKSGVVLTEDGEVKVVDNKFFDFKYRWSALKINAAKLLSCTLQLKKGDKEKIKSQMDEYLTIRAQRHPHKEGSAGCFFKNIKPTSNEGKVIPAGYLLEQVGAKEMRIGDAGVFSGHANIFVNLGQARAQDVKKMAEILKDKVKEKFGIQLEEEVIFLGEQ